MATVFCFFFKGIVGKDVEKLEYYWKQNGISTMENKTEVPYDHQYYSWVYIQKNWKQNLRALYINVDGNIIHFALKVEVMCPSVDEWISWIVYIYNRILFIFLKEGILSHEAVE